MTIHARVLGVAQDAGVPHAGCSCARCERFRSAPLFPACLGLVGEKSYLIDATPAFPEQIRMLPAFPSAIFLTHVHMGHIAGLLQLGEEACDAEMRIYAPEGACDFLRKNAPWNRLKLELSSAPDVELEEGLSVRAFPVRHRGLDTVGYTVHGPARVLTYLPDIDDWDGIQGHALSDLLEGCDLALRDGTFYSRDEVRRQSEIPHPPIVETLDRLSPDEAAKVRFTHFNHTNRLLDEDGPTALVAVQGERIPLDHAPRP